MSLTPDLQRDIQTQALREIAQTLAATLPKLVRATERLADVVERAEAAAREDDLQDAADADVYRGVSAIEPTEDTEDTSA